MTSSTRSHGGTHTLTGGWLRVEGAGGGPRFQLFGEHLLLAGYGADAGNCHPQQCRPCTAGAFSLESTFAGNNTFGVGPSVVNGTYYQSISYAGTLHITGNGQLANTSPYTDSRASRAVVIAPFTLSGNLIGLDGPEGVQDKPELFNVTLHGSGIAIVELDLDPSSTKERLYNFRDVTYDITHFRMPRS
jgi:hypothetical protein